MFGSDGERKQHGSTVKTPQRLRELAWVFLRMGALGFGGPAAHIALMEAECVVRRRWLTRAELMDMMSASNLIPGPNSTELALHIGRLRAGNWGLMVAGISFILPAFVLVLACAWVYGEAGTLPRVSHALYGIKPVMIGIVLQALWGLARSTVKSRLLALVTCGVALLASLGAGELLLLVGAGALVACVKRSGGGSRAASFNRIKGVVAAGSVPLGFATITLGGASTWSLFLFFLKIGSVLYGSGYVLLAFLQSGLVDHGAFLTQGQLLDAIAVGQMTPGPVFTTATFVGYLVSGVPGAAAATVGIFLPAFFFVLLTSPFLPRLRRSPVLSSVLDGVNAASLALMGVVSVELFKAAVVDVWSGAIFVCGVMLLAKRLNATWLIVGGGFVGMLRFGL